MKNKEPDPYGDLTMSLFGNVMSQMVHLNARLTALREVVVSLQIESSDRSRETLLLDLMRKEREELDRLLTEYEKHNPHLAGLLDKRDIEDIPDTEENDQS